MNLHREFQTVHPRHVQVRETEIDLALQDNIKRFRTLPSSQDRVFFSSLKEIREYLQDHFIIINNQNVQSFTHDFLIALIRRAQKLLTRSQDKTPFFCIQILLQ